MSYFYFTSLPFAVFTQCWRALFPAWNSTVVWLACMCACWHPEYARVRVCVCQRLQSCRRSPPSNLALFQLISSLKWPLISPYVSPSYLWALNGFTAAQCCQTWWLRSQQNPLFSTLFYAGQYDTHVLLNTIQGACHSWVWELLS